MWLKIPEFFLNDPNIGDKVSATEPYTFLKAAHSSIVWKGEKLLLSQAKQVDGWTSCSDQGYVTITSHHIDPSGN